MSERIVPGDIKINGVHIINSRGKRVDVTLIVQQIDIYEDITAPFITGKLFISDSLALGEILPLFGEELLVLDLESPFTNFKLNKTFFIYKMEGRENASMKNVVYTLDFVSIEAFTDLNCKISLKYDGKISDLVEKLIVSNPGLNTKKSIYIEQTVNREVYVSNFWSPIQNIYYLADRAVNGKETPSYMFFENNEGFVFASLDRLYQNPNYKTFTRHQITRTPNGVTNLQEEHDKILDMSTPVMFDYIDRLRHGYYGGLVYQYDVDGKTINYRHFIAKDDLKGNLLNKNQIESQNQIVFNPESNIKTNIIHKNIFANSPLRTVTHDLKRMAALRRLQGITTNIQVFGLLDYSVGQTFNLVIYKDTSEYKESTDEQMIDEVLSGKYLATSVHHKISKKDYFTHIELSKNSFNKALDDN